MWARARSLQSPFSLRRAVMTVELASSIHPSARTPSSSESVVKDVGFTTIFKGVLPFAATDILRLVILIAFPVIALWLPQHMR